MPVYQYKAATIDGEIFNGTLSGSSREQVVAQLQALGQIPIQVDETVQAGVSQRRSPRRRGGGRITDQHIANATRQLGTLLRAGMPLDRALSILATLSESERMKQLLEQVQEEVKSGATLADAMQAQEGVFSRFYLNLLRAGEAGGALEIVLERLAEHLEQSREIRDTLLSAVTVESPDAAVWIRNGSSPIEHDRILDENDIPVVDRAAVPFVLELPPGATLDVSAPQRLVALMRDEEVGVVRISGDGGAVSTAWTARALGRARLAGVSRSRELDTAGRLFGFRLVDGATLGVDLSAA